MPRDLVCSFSCKCVKKRNKSSFHQFSCLCAGLPQDYCPTYSESFHLGLRPLLVPYKKWSLRRRELLPRSMLAHSLSVRHVFTTNTPNMQDARWETQLLVVALRWNDPYVVLHSAQHSCSEFSFSLAVLKWVIA